MTGGWVPGFYRFQFMDEYPRNSGFTCAFPADKSPVEKFAQLKANEWIDASTRAIIIELGLQSTHKSFFHNASLL